VATDVHLCTSPVTEDCMRDLLEISYALAHKTKTVTIVSFPWVAAIVWYIESLT